ncbi:MAG: hypothetical protein Q8Q05_02325 [bacterium]|nr:hypothetical protein [bacterium]
MEEETIAKFADLNSLPPDSSRSQIAKEHGSVILYDCPKCEITWERTTANGKLTIRGRAVDAIDVIADVLDSDNPPEEVLLEVRRSRPKLP